MDDETFQTIPDLDDMIEQEAETVGPDEPAFGGLIAPAVDKKSPRRWIVTLRRQGTDEILVREQGDLNASTLRERVVEKAITKLGLGEDEGQALAEQLDQFLMEAAASDSSSNGQAAAVVGAVEYEAIIDPDDPEATGFYAEAEKYRQRLTNFVMRIEEDLISDDFDEEAESRRLPRHDRARRGGQPVRDPPRSVRQGAATGHLRGGGPQSRIPGPDRGDPDCGRSEQPPRSPPLSHFPGMEPGLHAVSLPRRLRGPRRLPRGRRGRQSARRRAAPQRQGSLAQPTPARPRGIAPVKRHILEDLMGINDRDVVSAMLAAVVLPIAMRPSGIVPWPLLWLAGLTGSGKSLLATLVANFYGDFGGPGSGRHMSWISSAVLDPHRRL